MSDETILSQNETIESDSDNVVNEQLQPASEQTAEAESALSQVDELKSRLAGLQRKLDSVLKERAKLVADLESYRSEAEKARLEKMSDLERLEYEKSKLAEELRVAKEEARRERLARRFPNAVALFDPGDPLPSESRLATIEKKLTAQQSVATESAGTEEANNPMRQLTPEEEDRRALNQAFLGLFGRLS
jgi:predicted nuclease with TOPRIM domain